MKNISIPENVKNALIERYGYAVMKIYVANGKEYALYTPEAKESCRGIRYKKIPADDWAKLAIRNYTEKQGEPLKLTIYKVIDPRGNGRIMEQKFALITAQEQKYINRIIEDGRAIGKEEKEVETDEWLQYAIMSYFEENTTQSNPNDDELYNISFEELEEYNEGLTSWEK